MSLLGNDEKTFDYSRLDPIVLDPIIQGIIALSTGLMKVWDAIKALATMLKNVDLRKHAEYLFGLLFKALIYRM